MEKKGTRRTVLLLAVIVLLGACGIIALRNAMDTAGDHGEVPVRNIPAVAEKTHEVKAPALPARHIIPPKKRQTDAIRSNDDIKRVYGRVETVSLFNGKSYTGAVIGRNAVDYTIVTVGGVKKVTMSDVKVRKIIR